MNEILNYLKTHGEQLDKEIAVAAGVSLNKARIYLSELAAKGEVVACHSIKFENGKRIEGMKCRLAGHPPPTTPGRKSK